MEAEKKDSQPFEITERDVCPTERPPGVHRRAFILRSALAGCRGRPHRLRTAGLAT